MINRTAAIVTSGLLVAAILGLLLTIVSVIGADEATSHATMPEFRAVESLPAQSAPADEDLEGEEEEAPERAEETKRAEAPARAKPAPRPAKKKPRAYKAAVLQIVTNFEKADVTVNGLRYPEYFEPDAPEGMVLPAGGPYQVLVKFGEKTKHYVVNLRPYETRLLLVELSGYNSDAPRPAPAVQKKAQKSKEPQKKDDKPDPKAPGRITVYSKPAGTVVVDGKSAGEKTPGTVELENGRHEVQVQYETGSISEKKIVRVRTGSRIKLFFRERKK